MLSSYSVKSVRTRSYSRPYYPTFGLNLRMQLECRKMRTKIIPNMDTFHAVSYATGCYILLEFSLSILIYYNQVNYFDGKIFFEHLSLGIGFCLIFK